MKNRMKRIYSSIKKYHFIPITLAPALIILGAYVYYPTLFSLYLSFFKTQLYKTVEFVGLEHYLSLFHDQVFRIAFKNTLVYSVGAVSGTIVVGLGMALLLDSPLKGKDIFRSTFFMPYVIPFAAHALLWYWILDPRYGLVNHVLGFFGINPIPWLQSRSWVLPAFILMDVWKRSGFAMVLFLAGLQTIPDELYDAATVDGASEWKKFWKVTLPLLRPVTLFVVIMSLLHTLQLFVEPFLMTKGGPGQASLSVVYLIYREGFRTLNIGRSSAMAVILFLVIFIITILLIQFFDIEEIY